MPQPKCLCYSLHINFIGLKLVTCLYLTETKTLTYHGFKHVCVLKLYFYDLYEANMYFRSDNLRITFVYIYMYIGKQWPLPLFDLGNT